MDTNVHYAAKGALITHAGKVRCGNEDCCIFGGIIVWDGLSESIHAICPAGAPWLIAVADGIGGQNAGERASRQVIYTLATCED